jgi:hypothetical protein
MIRYRLCCSAGHEFDGWFADSKTFDDQLAKGLIACPDCASVEVGKALMAPALAGGRKQEAMPVAANVAEDTEHVAILRKLRQRLTESAEYVGPKFPEEARRIHYAEAEKRGIYGEASPEEARALSEEGIEFHPLPVLPEDHN